MQKVSIIGLGYVGMPLARMCVKKGFATNGFDIDPKTVDRLSGEFEGKADVSADPASLAGSNVFIVCVPTPAPEGKPDLGAVKDACADISKYLQKGNLVVIESTIYPGTVRNIAKPILEKSGLEAGEDFYLAHCPERIDPGNEKWFLENIPRVLGAISSAGLGKAQEFYGKLITAKVTSLNSVEAAEAVKVMENVFRDVNIAYINELAKSFDKMGIDISEVIKGASTKPFGFMPFLPGPGVGGHCIAQDPYYLIERAKEAGFQHKFLMLAREINNSMPDYVVSLLESSLEKAGIKTSGAKVAVLGTSYKPEVTDTRESPALRIIELLENKKCTLKIFDPFADVKNNADSMEGALQDADAVVLVTHHRQFIEKLTPAFLKNNGIKVVIDARNMLDREGITKQGIIYKGIGR